ncbi:MAG: transcriptional regulator [Halobacteria archaeon]
MRKNLVDETVTILEEGGFVVSDRCNIRPKSFDVAARRGSEILLIKVLSNIDSFNHETAAEMKALAKHLDASCLVVGAKTRNHRMEQGVLYLRSGVPAINPETAYDYFVEDVPPLVYMAQGGLYANLDGDVLADLREEDSRSLGRIANELGVSRRSVSKYEDGMDATLDVALELEEMFEHSLISPIEILSHGDDEDIESREDVELHSEEKRVFDNLSSAGYLIHTTARAPFRAFTDSETGGDVGGMLTGTIHHSGDIDKRARLMSSISDVAETRSIYVVESSASRDSIEDTVIVEIEELEDVEESEELDELHKEKGG